MAGPIHDGVFRTPCHVSKSHAMCCDRKFNMLNILPDFGISQLFVIRFLNGFQHFDGDLIGLIGGELR